MAVLEKTEVSCPLSEVDEKGDADKRTHYFLWKII
jgi:hypothetical protein